jgi:hypothetical protein
MDAMTGFLIYFAFAILIAVIAFKKGLTWWLYFVAVIALGPLSVMGLSEATHATQSSSDAAFAAFMVPILALCIVLFRPNAREIAAEKGEFGDFKKCPYCAESVRKEAVKCRHCGSSFEATAG